MNQIFVPDFYSNFFSELILSYPDRVTVILLATLISLFFGLFFGKTEKYAVPFLWKLSHNLFAKFVQKADKANRTQSSLIFRGGLLTILLVIMGCVISFLSYKAIATFPLYRILDVLLVVLCISTGQIIHLLAQMHALLTKKGMGRHDESRLYSLLAKSSRSD